MADATYIVRLYFKDGLAIEVPVVLADDEEPDLTWFLGQSDDVEERKAVLTEGQFAWKTSEVIAAEWEEEDDDSGEDDDEE